MKKLYLFILSLITFQAIFFYSSLYCQSVEVLKSIQFNNKEFSFGNYFINNIGQYDNIKPDCLNKKILFGYEANGLPIVFSMTSITHFQGRIENQENDNAKDDDKKNQLFIKSIEMTWMNANTNSTIIKEQKQDAYHTYGMLLKKAHTYKSIIYQNIYPNIDLIYSIVDNQKGYQFSLLLRPGAKYEKIALRFDGDISKYILKRNILRLENEFGGIGFSAPISYYTATKKKIKINFSIKKNILQFNFPNNYDRSKEILIDPFVNNTGSFTGDNSDIAKDIDYDYIGNTYVSGGGNGFGNLQYAKYDINGVHQWTFSSILSTPNWFFGLNYGGFVVDKSSGISYLGQGFGSAYSGNQRIIGLDQSGVFNNFITDSTLTPFENWKLLWNCNASSTGIFVAGGTGASNHNFGVFSPPSTNIVSKNITGIAYTPSGFPPVLWGGYQDIADFIFDPVTNELYSLFSNTALTPYIGNRIYKHVTPYNSINKIWDTLTGFTGLLEANNRQYLAIGALGVTDNSANVLTLNQNYLFYWDGVHLKSFNKTTGGGINAINVVEPSTHLPLYSGGIIADACDNVYIGKDSGTIKVYHFTAAGGFDDSPPDIKLPPPYAMDTTYDLAYDEAKHLLYACGSGFVASFDISAYCAATTYTLNVISNCVAGTAQATVSPITSFPITYNLYTGSTFISSNTSGNFSGLTNGIPYTIIATINLACSGPQCSNTFTLGTPISMAASKTNATCGNNNGTITVTVSSGTPPYQYSIDNGVTYQLSNTFTNLSASSYNVLAKDATTCGAASVPISIVQLNAPTILPLLTHATCGNNNGAITINTTGGGQSPYQYSINGGGSYQASNIFTNVTSGNYLVRVRDTNNCVRDSLVTIYNGCLNATAIVSNTSCVGNDGIITINASTGVAPYQYSIDNGLNYQPSNAFTNLTPNNYTLTVKDAIGAITTVTSTVALTNTINLSAGANQTICEGKSTALNAATNATSVQWSPPTNLSNAAIINPTANPTVTTKYYITATTGVCTKTDSTIVTVNPAPIANAGNDVSICYGKNVQLSGSGGSSYLWSPATYLNNATIQNPIVQNPNTGIIKYALVVTDGNNCSSLNTATVTIAVAAPAKLFAGNDTSVAINQPIQLYAIDINSSSFVNYTWSPAFGLNNSSTQNPVAILDKDITYFITATTANSCQGKDTINIKVYKGPEIYVPTAFTPNSDGLNDVVKAIPIGMKQFNYFIIYNRYGQKVFETKDASKGWDGTYKGSKQNTGAFAWMAQAVDYKGNVVNRKGSSILVR